MGHNSKTTLSIAEQNFSANRAAIAYICQQKEKTSRVQKTEKATIST